MSTVRVPVIIPSAKDDRVMVKGYFDGAHVNQLPFATSTLIDYLINDIDRVDTGSSDFKLGNKYLIVDKEQKNNYEGILGSQRPGLRLIVQKEYGVRGLFYAIDDALKESKVIKSAPRRPFMVMYGDTLIQDDFLTSIINIGRQRWIENRNDGLWMVIGLVVNPDCDTGLKSYWEDSRYDFERNRWAHYAIDRDSMAARDGYVLVETDQIRDIINPSFPPLYASEDSVLVMETGCFILSYKAWELLRKFKNADAQGLYSITNALRRAIMEKADLAITGVVSKKSEDWIDINYPWEYLKSNDYMINRMLSVVLEKRASNRLYEHPYVKRSGYRIVFNKEELSLLHPFTPPEYPGINAGKLRKSYYNEYDNQLAWGVEADSKIDFPIIVPEGGEAKIYVESGASIGRSSVLKKNSRIRSGAIVKSSIIGENVLIDHFSYIDHSVIMDNAKVFPHSIVPYSIIGKAVILGGNVLIACERLDWSSKFKSLLARFREMQLSMKIEDIVKPSEPDLYGNIPFWDPSVVSHV